MEDEEAEQRGSWGSFTWKKTEGLKWEGIEVK